MCAYILTLQNHAVGKATAIIGHFPFEQVKQLYYLINPAMENGKWKMTNDCPLTDCFFGSPHWPSTTHSQISVLNLALIFGSICARFHDQTPARKAT